MAIESSFTSTTIDISKLILKRINCPNLVFKVYSIAGKFGGEFNLAVWRSPTAPTNFNFCQINFRHIRTQELRNEILLRNRKSPHLNSANI